MPARQIPGRTVMRRAGALALVVAFAATGCGGSDEDDAKSAIKSAYSSFSSGDADGFCMKLSGDYRADFEEYYQGRCDAATIHKIADPLGPDSKKKLEQPDIAKVSVDGDKAEATVND